MKNTATLFIALLSLCLTAKAQSTGKIDLSIVDQQQRPSSQAFVELLSAKDSSMVQFATADNMGHVEFKDLRTGNYIAFVPEIGSTSFATYLFNIHNYDEAYDITLLCKACTEVTIISSKKVSKIG